VSSTYICLLDITPAPGTSMLFLNDSKQNDCTRYRFLYFETFHATRVKGVRCNVGSMYDVSKSTCAAPVTLIEFIRPEMKGSRRTMAQLTPRG
jgi:hypothetical protein